MEVVSETFSIKLWRAEVFMLGVFIVFNFFIKGNDFNLVKNANVEDVKSLHFLPQWH
jgi:hypothetical protein